MKRTVLLTTDLYHPHNDPNDHWNLATLYAMHREGLIHLAGILCDEDKPNQKRWGGRFGDPSIESVAQLNYLTASAVPIGIGSHTPLTCDADLAKAAENGHKVSSIALMLSVLESSEAPVDIHMTGSCRDVVVAAAMRPDLFRRVRIFLNAGTWGSQDPLEYNVSLEPYSFSRVFEIPCEICWAPCFEKLERYPYHVSERANYYEIDQGDYLPYLSSGLQNYFLYMYDHVREGWLSYIQGPVDETRIRYWSGSRRQMWSTPGFLLSAGLTCSITGELTAEAACPQPLFRYTPVRVQCGRDGHLTWADADEETGIRMFRLYDTQRYAAAMGKVVLDFLKKI